MDRLFFNILFFITVQAAGQTMDTAHILLRTGHCRSAQYFNPTIPDSVRLFRQPEDILITTVYTRHEHRYPISLTLPKGSYRLVYPNIYGQIIDKKYSFYEDTATEVALCPDSLINYPQNTLARLKNKESITITYQSQGCFHNFFNRIILRRVYDHIQARLYGDTMEYYLKGDSVHYRPKRNVLIGRKTLTPEDSLAFIGFENELRARHKGGCTTQDYYTIKSKYWNCHIRDGGCTWPGFYSLTTAWFGQPGPYRTIPSSSHRVPAWAWDLNF
jgi:hypothetical protein